MTARVWYLRRAVAWLPVLGGCGAAMVVAALLARWPDGAFVLAPALLACCAAAAAFAYDEDALPVVAVTPRGAGWRRVNRLAVALAPLSVWAVVVALRPGDVALARPQWWLLGGGAVLLVAGSAALASRRLVPTPGALLAPVAALATVAPVTLAGMFSWGTLYPIGDFPGAVRTVWAGVALVGAVVCTVALRPGLRPLRAASPGRPTGSAAWAMRLAGLGALVNGVGFGAFDIPAVWHLAHDHEVWYALGNPTYGNGPFEAHGIAVTVPVLIAFLVACLVLAVGGGILLAPRPAGVVVTLAGAVMCAPFWWGFNLPLAWVNAATVLVLLALAWGVRLTARSGLDAQRGPEPVARPTSDS